MATIYNSDLSKELQQGARLQIRDKMPSELAEKVVPVMEVNPKLLRRVNIIKGAACTNATSTTIYTTPSDRDFFITHAQLTVIKDVTSTSTLSRIIIVLDGATVPLIQIGGITLTVQDQNISFSFNTPIKVDRGTTITITNSTNVANINSIAAIGGYIVDNSNA